MRRLFAPDGNCFDVAIDPGEILEARVRQPRQTRAGAASEIENGCGRVEALELFDDGKKRLVLMTINRKFHKLFTDH